MRPSRTSGGASSNTVWSRSTRNSLFGWYCKKLGVPDLDALKDFYRSKQRVLEVGPGLDFNTRFIAENCPGEVFALDVSDAAFTTFENTRDLRKLLRRTGRPDGGSLR